MPNLQETENPNKTNSSEQERIDQLVCQITDGFLRGDEKREPKDTRPFEELLTNLLPRAGLFARNVVAQKLGSRADMPRRILEMMLEDDAAVVEPLIVHSQLLSEQDITKLINRRDPILRQAIFKRRDLTLMQRQSLLLDMPVRAKEIKPRTLQVAAQAATLPMRQEEPIKIDMTPKVEAAPVSAEIQTQSPEVTAPEIAASEPTPQKQGTKLLQDLVRAAVLRRHEELASLIAAETNLSSVITQALLKDVSGEALMAVCHHISVAEDAAVQIATLLYPALLRTREQLTALRQLYRHFTPQATERIISAWRALPHNATPVHETVHVGETTEAKTAARAPVTHQHKIASNQ